MAPDFPLSASSFFHSQLRVKLPVPTKSFAGETVIVTGSNTGLGLEGARHIARLGPERLILAVRTLEKGQRAAADICRTTGLSKDAIHVWQLDLSKYDSIQKFAARVDAELPRLDVVIENAGILTENFVWAEDDESTIKTNVLGTMFLAILLLPKQRQTAEQFNKDVVHTFTGSWMHWTTDFAERHAPNVFAELADDKKAKMSNNERYKVSKLIQLLVFREFVNQLTQPKSGHIITSILNPGGVNTDVVRDDMGAIKGLFIRGIQATLMRTAEVGGRTLAHAAEGSRDTDGQYLTDCKPADPKYLSPFVKSEEGIKTQKKLWKEMLARFELVRPGISQLV